MSAIAMHNVIVKLDATVGATALTDITEGVLQATLNVTKNVGGHHTLGNDWQQQTVGGKIASGTIRARVDKTTATAYDYLSTAVITDAEGDRRSVEFYTPDASAGSLKYSGEIVFSTMNNAVNGQGGSGDAQVTDFNFAIDGTLTKAVVSA